jgi:hypothetical protein
VDLLRNAVHSAEDDDGWSRVNDVRQQIGNQASFDQRNYGYSTLTKLLAATDLFEFATKARRTWRCARSRRAAAGPSDCRRSTGRNRGSRPGAKPASRSRRPGSGPTARRA